MCLMVLILKKKNNNVNDVSTNAAEDAQTGNFDKAKNNDRVLELSNTQSIWIIRKKK